MPEKLPRDAFAYYFSLGERRSHQAVAEKYGVSKRAVTQRAVKERWKGRTHELEEEAREKLDQKLAESLETMNHRHLKTLQVIQGKALETLKAMPISSAMDAVRALDMAIGKERVIRGEPSDRSAVSVEEVIKREYDRWMAPSEEEADDR